MIFKSDKRKIMSKNQRICINTIVTFSNFLIKNEHNLQLVKYVFKSMKSHKICYFAAVEQLQFGCMSPFSTTIVRQLHYMFFTSFHHWSSSCSRYIDNFYFYQPGNLEIYKCTYFRRYVNQSQPYS